MENYLELIRYYILNADKYLVCYEYASGRQEVHIEIWDENRNCFNCFLENIITHWKLLPQPPKQ